MKPSDSVYVFRWWDRTLVFHTRDFHKPNRVSTFDRDGHTWTLTESMSDCGKPVYEVETWGEWPWRDGAGEWRSRENAHWLRLDHALVIGRPCQRCFPSGNPLDA